MTILEDEVKLKEFFECLIGEYTKSQYRTLMRSQIMNSDLSIEEKVKLLKRLEEI